MGSPLDAGRRIAGLLGYNPGPGLYSRMTRAVEGMPAVIRTQELPGLLRKYPEGVPGWEVKAVAPALEGVQSISRQDLLDLIQQHSPVYTHREKMLGGDDQSRSRLPYVSLGESTPSARPIFEDYGQGGRDYRELLILQPGAVGESYGSHWDGVFGANNAVAHARYDTHGDALRINELQSDLGIHNRKMREQNAEYERWARERGVDPGRPASGQGELPFPLEDAWADILIKRLALEAARGGHRAIEVASPRAIADQVGGNIDNYEHFYGKVVPGAIERLGRKLGGLTPVPEPVAGGGRHIMHARAQEEFDNILSNAGNLVGTIDQPDRLPSWELLRLHEAMRRGLNPITYAEDLQRHLVAQAVENGWPESAAAALVSQAMPKIMRQAEDLANMASQSDAVAALARERPAASAMPPSPTPGRRYLMSDEMRKRILEGGIGLSVLGGLSAQEE